jgi:hypothetical protein
LDKGVPRESPSPKDDLCQVWLKFALWFWSRSRKCKSVQRDGQQVIRLVDLVVNVAKTKVVVLRNGGKVRTNEKWVYMEENIEILDQFVYLGVLLNFNVSYLKTISITRTQSVICIIKASTKQLFLNQCASLSLFDTYACCILNYGCEVWGMHRAPDIEKVHLESLKSVLGVRRNTNTTCTMIHFETGRLPLYHVRILRMFKFWFKLLQTENCVLGAAYEYLYNVCENTKRNSHNWAVFVKEQLHCLGLSYMWHNQSNLNTNVCMPIIKLRLRDLFIQNVYSNLEHEPKFTFYKHLVDKFLSSILPKKNLHQKNFKNVYKKYT